VVEIAGRQKGQAVLAIICGCAPGMREKISRWCAANARALAEAKQGFHEQRLVANHNKDKPLRPVMAG